MKSFLINVCTKFLQNNGFKVLSSEELKDLEYSTGFGEVVETFLNEFDGIQCAFNVAENLNVSFVDIAGQGLIKAQLMKDSFGLDYNKILAAQSAIGKLNDVLNTYKFSNISHKATQNV